MTVADCIANVQQVLEPHVESGALPGYVAGVTVGGVRQVCAGGALALDSDAEMEPDPCASGRPAARLGTGRRLAVPHQQ